MKRKLLLFFVLLFNLPLLHAQEADTLQRWLKIKYNASYSFSEGLALVGLGGKYGFVDTTGKEVIPLIYDGAYSFSEGLAMVSLRKKWGYINKSGQEVIPLLYDHAIHFRKGFAVVQLDDKYGFIDKTGKQISSFKYDYVDYRTFEGLKRVELNDKWGFVDTTGQEITAPKYDYVGQFREGLSVVALEGKWGYIDKSGQEITALKYDRANSFSEGLAEVKLNGKWGFIDKKGIYEAVMNDLKQQIQYRVEKKINQWQKKGEFEPTSAYKKRVNEQSRKEKIKFYTQDVIGFYGKKLIDLSQKKLDRYDADNQIFKVVFSKDKSIYLKVPLSIAPQFKENFATVKFQNPRYGFANEELIISHIEAIYEDKTYVYDANKPINYANTEIQFNFEPIEIPSSTVIPKTNHEPTNIVIGKADIHENLPKTKNKNSQAIAVIIGNSDYEKTQKLPYAVRDAKIMKKYLIEVLGFKEGNILYVENAGLAEFQTLFGKKDQHKGKLYNTVRPNISDVFVYYSGHGAPDDKASAYFVPTECDPNFVALNGYTLKTFYDNLAKIPAKSFTIVIDACFSGEEITTAGKRPIEVKSKGVAGLQKGTLLASSDGTQFSCDYIEKGHGLFTYFFLKAIHNQNADKNQDKKLTFEEIHQYVGDNAYGVPYEARRLHNTTQIPQLKTENAKEVLVEYK